MPARPGRDQGSRAAASGRRRRSRRARAAGPGRSRRRSAAPDGGSITCTPRRRRVATLARVAGCSHISVCIAGASTTGQRAVSRVAVSRSSARPWRRGRAGRPWPVRRRPGRPPGRGGRARPRRPRTRRRWPPARRRAPPRSAPRRNAARPRSARPVPDGRPRSAAAAASRPCTRRCRRPRPG